MESPVKTETASFVDHNTTEDDVKLNATVENKLEDMCSSNNNASTVKRRRRDRSHAEIEAILEQFDALPPNTTIRQAARNLGVTYATLHKWLRNRRTSCRRPLQSNRKRRRLGLCPSVETALLSWVRLVNDKPLTGPLLKSKGQELAKKLGVQGFKGSDGWLERFKKRNNISTTTNTSGRTSFDKWPKCWSEIREEYEVTEIWSAVETRIFTRELINFGSNEDFGNDVKELDNTLVVFLCCSMGGQKKELFLASSTKQDKLSSSLRIKLASTQASSSGGCTSLNFREWLQKWNAELLSSQERAIVLLRRTLAHSDDIQLSNLRVQILPDSLSSPLEMGIVKDFLIAFKKRLDQAICSYSCKKFPDRIWSLFWAWEEVSENLVQSSWLQLSNSYNTEPSSTNGVGHPRAEIVTEDDIVKDVQLQYAHSINGEWNDNGSFEKCNDLFTQPPGIGHPSVTVMKSSPLLPSMQDMLEASRLIREGLTQRGYRDVEFLEKIDEEIKSTCCLAALRNGREES